MKILMLISSKYGSTEKCGQLIKKELKGKKDIVNLENQTCNDINSYDTVIIGGGIYAGNLQGNLKKFVEEKEKTLKNKNIGIFLCCKEEGNQVTEYIKTNLPNSIFENAFIKERVGYEISLEKMNFIVKFMMKTFFKIKENQSEIDNEAIKRIIDKTNRLDVKNG